jgi:hypothetical protein
MRVEAFARSGAFLTTASVARTSLRITVTRLGVAVVFVLGTALNLSNPPGMIAYLPYAAVAALLIIRRPAHVVGWLLALMAAAFAIVGRPIEVIEWAVETGHQRWLPLIAWFGTMAAMAIFAGMAALAAVFPTGALPGGNAGRATRAALAVIAVLALMQSVDPEFAMVLPDGTPFVIRNPLGVAPGWAGWSLFDGPGYLIVLGGVVVCTLGLIARFRRATGIERQQDKWLIASLALVAVAVVFGFVALVLIGSYVEWLWVPAIVAFPLPAIAIGIAITRFRLYDIDRIVSRTIAYGVITAALVGVYAASILVLQQLLGTITAGNTLAVAASTLAVAALFQPIRRRTQRAVDRRFNRARYDLERTVSRFTSRLRDDMEVAVVASAIVQAAARSVEPTTASVWLRSGR